MLFMKASLAEQHSEMFPMNFSFVPKEPWLVCKCRNYFYKWSEDGILLHHIADKNQQLIIEARYAHVHMKCDVEEGRKRPSLLA